MIRMVSEVCWLGVTLCKPPASAHFSNLLITVAGVGLYAGLKALLGLQIEIAPVWLVICFAALTLLDFGFRPIRYPVQTVLMLALLVGLAQMALWTLEWLRYLV